MPRKAKDEKQREDIELIAWELYGNRHRPGKRLNKDGLWKEAEKIVTSPLRTTLFASNRPLIKIEKQVWEPILAWANNQALLSLLGIISNAGIIIAVFTYIGTEKQRRDVEVLNAWQTITSAHGQSGSGGRIQALEFLNTSPGANWRRKFPWFCAPNALCTWSSEPLDGINLGVEPIASLEPRIQSDLPGGETTHATQPDDKAEGVYLAGIQLPRASLWKADLQGADLGDANLQEASLGLAELQGANLRYANLQRANLQYANLQGARLWNTNLQGADLGSAELQGTDLLGSNLQGASLVGTNLRYAKSLTEVQLTTAQLCRTTLPDDITLDANRDCKELGIAP